MDNRIAAIAVAAASVLALPLAASAQAAPGFPPVNVSVAKPRAAVAAGVTPAATTATPKAAQVQVVDDDAHAPYQEGGFVDCVYAGACSFAYSPVPSGHRRVIEHFSCSVYLPAPGLLRYVSLLSNTFALPRDFFPFTRSPADSAQSFVNSPTLLRFEAGEVPLAYAYAESAPIQEMFCTVSGRDITLP
jgi:hypothetical protein